MRTDGHDEANIPFANAPNKVNLNALTIVCYVKHRCAYSMMLHFTQRSTKKQI